MEQAIVYIGIDVAKAYLDVSWAGQARRFSNERSGHAALVCWLKTSPAPVQSPCVAAFTWPHSRPLASTRSCRASINVCAPKVNPTN